MFGKKKNSNRPSQIQRPLYMGDQGTWTQRGPVGVVEQVPNPPWIGTTDVYTGTVGMSYIRTLLYMSPYITPNGLNPYYAPPNSGKISNWGQPLAPAVGEVEFYGSGG